MLLDNGTNMDVKLRAALLYMATLAAEMSNDVAIAMEDNGPMGVKALSRIAISLDRMKSVANKNGIHTGANVNLMFLEVMLSAGGQTNGMPG
jgi:hypothetical protein